MSNKIVPSIYRSVIDDVIAAIRPAFDEFGVADDVLDELQNKWEMKVIASRVAEFDPGTPAHHPYPAQARAAQHYTAAPSYIPPSAAQQRAPVKPEPIDPRYALAAPQYALPPLPGPQLGGLVFPAGLNHAHLYRLPQTDGPSEEDDDEDDDEDDGRPAGYAPRTAHPSLPQPTPKTETEADPAEAINSDLDDSDTENEEDPDDAGPETDIVFCTYDKVARVKNKWKCVLKDGMIHTGGKDYLFQRCTGEFEW
ncbi:transcription factor IIA alpha/beta subunit [Mycena crocata]|nr:transcription factor IIA alpha/beta subunit [Mycena crocata]